MPFSSTRTPAELFDRMTMDPPLCVLLPSSRILPVSFVPHLPAGTGGDQPRDRNPAVRRDPDRASRSVRGARGDDGARFQGDVAMDRERGRAGRLRRVAEPAARYDRSRKRSRGPSEGQVASHGQQNATRRAGSAPVLGEDPAPGPQRQIAGRGDPDRTRAGTPGRGGVVVAVDGAVEHQIAVDREDAIGEAVAILSGAIQGREQDVAAQSQGRCRRETRREGEQA